jgi:cobalt/nickel transport protein
MMKKAIMLTLALTVFTAMSASAHFQMLYTPESALDKGETIQLRHVFTHPFADEHTMDMGKQHDSDTLAPVEEFFVVNKEKKTDLKSTLKPIEFKGNENSGKGFASEYKARSMGDHVLVIVPAPYYEANEEAYIQQITKVVVNVAGAPTDWDADLGLKAEIVPLTKPYSIWTGSTFTGIVMSEGKPVPFAEIEVEYLNHEVDLAKNAMGKAKVKAPQDSFVTLGIKADQNGKFTFGLPKAGWWGFAALGVGSDDQYKGKELSQDAVIWVQVKDMK